ncbi:DUF99 family protein [Haloarchaeobius amylolyticus]|uniref:UPF0215 protein ACFR99_05400 n=1 Tax=Haloarchaeobius amylolyticus TaxID=1198296 RepID=A0ABD6BEF8_9EURY
MKSGVRALGIAESYRGDRGRSTLAGAVVRADRVCDGLAYSSCRIGGTDATDAVLGLLDDLERPDIRYVLLGAVAPAWYNLLDLSRIHETAERPVIAVTFEASDGLAAGLREAFSGPELEARLETYRALPERRELSLDSDTVYVRAVGLESDEAAEIVRAFTPAGGRPEPIRVARLAARAADSYARSGAHSE